MKILLINHYSGTNKLGMEYRPYYLAKKWVESGHNVTILAASFSHLRINQPSVVKNLEIEFIDGIKYIWVKTPKYYNSNFLRIINILTFVVKLFTLSKRILDKEDFPDFIIASSTYPFDIFPAYYYSKISNAKLIFELHDLWPLSPIEIGGYSKLHPFILSTRIAAKFAYSKCDICISILPHTKDYLIKEGLNSEKFYHIPNGFLFDEWKSNHNDLPVDIKNEMVKFTNNNKFIIGYIGGHNKSNNLDYIIKAANLMKLKDIIFVFVGKGENKKKLVAESKKFQLNNVFFFESIPKQTIPELLKFFDVGIITGVDSGLHKFGTSSNKVIDYMLSSLPIIFAINENNSLVETVECGVQINAGDINKLAETINYFYSLSYKDRVQIGDNGKNYALNNLEYTTLAQKIIKIFNEN